MGDVVQRLRDGVDAGAVDLADIMDAADEIERLRQMVPDSRDRLRAQWDCMHAKAGAAVLDNCVAGNKPEIPCPPTLTDAEREAVEGAIINMETRGVWAWPATLRGLLQRLEVTCPVPEPMPKEKRA